MSSADINAVQLAEVVRMGTQIADAAVLADIRSFGVMVFEHQLAWYDVRPMLDQRERSLQCVDMATMALQYALVRGLVRRHSQHAHLVRINPRS
jgi:hypothetical protein